MVRTIPKKLDGGRTALYRGKDAYASQTFEDDQRAQAFSGLLIAYLHGNQSLTPSVNNNIVFAPRTSKFYKNLILRKFIQLASQAAFMSQGNGTYKLSLGVETYSGPVQAIINVQRGNDQLQLVAEASAASGSVGDIKPFGGSTIPANTVLCDGSAISRTTYANLFAVIGTTWGAGNGSTTFNVPDLRGRAIIGSGTGSGLTARTLGTQNIGEETHQLVTAELASHQHAVALANDGGVLAGNIQLATTGNTYKVIGSGTVGAQGSGAGLTANTGLGTAHNNMQPSAVCTWVINTGLVDPSASQSLSQNWIVDLQHGDIISLLVNPGPGSPVLRGGSSADSSAGGVLETLGGTKLIAEQIDT